ncbi:hypothetical protein FQA39_LY18418 [Lamprigera yunnana]|nr:hypothetical protein FQA39_LY18418 [Lamprigera yunnana]
MIYVLGLLKQIIRKQNIIQATLLQLVNNVNYLKTMENIKQKLVAVNNSIFPIFEIPLKDDENLLQLEQYLENEKQTNDTIRGLSRIGGLNNGQDFVKRLMSMAIALFDCPEKMSKECIGNEHSFGTTDTKNSDLNMMAAKHLLNYNSELGAKETTAIELFDCPEKVSKERKGNELSFGTTDIKNSNLNMLAAKHLLSYDFELGAEETVSDLNIACVIKSIKKSPIDNENLPKTLISQNLVSDYDLPEPNVAKLENKLPSVNLPLKKEVKDSSFVTIGFRLKSDNADKRSDHLQNDKCYDKKKVKAEKEKSVIKSSHSSPKAQAKKKLSHRRGQKRQRSSTPKLNTHKRRKYKKSGTTHHSDNSSPYNFTKPEDCFQAVKNRWGDCLLPNPHKDLTCRYYSSLPRYNTNFSIHGSLDKTVDCLLVYTSQIQQVESEIETIQQNLDSSFLLMDGSTINQNLDQIAILRVKANKLRSACDEANRFYSFYKNSETGWNACYISPYHYNEIQHHLNILNSYPSFYGGSV